MDNIIAYEGKMVPIIYQLTKDEYDHPNQTKPVPDDKSLYISSLAVLNGIQQLAFLSFFNNSDYERGLIDALNSNGTKSINLMKNLWIIYRDDAYKRNAMYILSLFIPNSIEDEVAQQIKHTFKYTNHGVNPYDYINETVMGYPTSKIKDRMFREYKTNVSIFETDTNNSDIGDPTASPFDAIFDFISSECDKLLHYLFNESTIFKEFVKSNHNRIGKLPEFRPKVEVPKIGRPKIINLLEPPKINNQKRGKKGKRSRNKTQRVNILTQLGYVSK